MALPRLSLGGVNSGTKCCSGAELEAGNIGLVCVVSGVGPYATSGADENGEHILGGTLQFVGGREKVWFPKGMPYRS